MPPRELAHIAVEMLATHLVIHAVITALETGPEAFHVVRMGHVADILADRVFHRFIGSGDSLVSAGVVGVDLCAGHGAIFHEAL